MKYTVRFAHLQEPPKWKIGDKITRGNMIGIMGNTGQSTAAHLHIDCVVGEINKPFKLCDIGTRYAPDQKQLDYFIDDELFGVKPVITTKFLDPEYKQTFGKDHPAYDVVPVDRHERNAHKNIYWNRSYVGTISLIVNQPNGYGHCVYITFDSTKKE